MNCGTVVDLSGKRRAQIPAHLWFLAVLQCGREGGQGRSRTAGRRSTAAEASACGAFMRPNARSWGPESADRGKNSPPPRRGTGQLSMGWVRAAPCPVGPAPQAQHFGIRSPGREEQRAGTGPEEPSARSNSLSHEKPQSR